MYQSNDFQEGTITINDKTVKMEYELKNPMPGSYTAFGNIYLDPEKPFPFMFFTIDDKIAGYTPMNAKKEVMSNIVSTILGKKLPFEEAI